jgi:glycosyltransferase involved in cell wall biosynthesis
MRSLKIGINALYLIPGGVGGTEIYLRNLVAALARIDYDNQYFLYTNRETGEGLLPPVKNFHSRPQNVVAKFRPARILWEQTKLVSAVQADQIDVLINPGFTAPYQKPCAQVTVFHDLQHKTRPENFRWFDLPFWNLLLGIAVQRSDHLIAVSAPTAKDLAKYYDVQSDQVSVVGHGIEPEFFSMGGRREHSFDEKMLLCVSTLHPHKNLERLIRVFGQFRERYGNVRLVLAGMRGFHANVLENLITELRLQDSVTITGWLPRDQLYKLYARAWAFVYPSEFEGFGMPVSESLAAGIPTACSDIPPLREIAGDAAVFFPAQREDAMLFALEQVMLDEALRRQLSEQGPKQVAAFSWNAAAQQTLDVLKMVVA